MKARIVFFIFLLCLLSACGKEKKDTTIIFGVAQKPQNFDPSSATDAASERINRLLYSYLFNYDDSFTVNSKLVDWRYDGNLHYSFTLKENLPFFTNMEQMNINDIVNSIQYLKDSKTSRYRQELSIIQSIKINSLKTFQITLKKFDPNFLNRLEIPILPNKLLKKDHIFSLLPVGSGPFSIVSKENKIEFKRKSDNQVIEFLEIKDPTVRALKLMRNELDIMQNDLPLATVDFLRKQSNINVQEKAGSNITYLGFNFNNKYLQIKEVRAAIEMAINKHTFLAYFFNKKTRSANQLFPPEHWVHASLTPNNYDPDKAREIIKKYNNGETIEIVYKTSTDPFRMKVATIIQNQLARIGVKLTIKSLDWGTYFRDIQAGNFDMYSLTWVGIKNPNIYEKIFLSKNIPPLGLNRGHYKNIEFDSLVKKSLDSNLWSPTIRFIFNDVAFIPLWFEGNVVAHSKKIKFYNLKNDGNWDSLISIEKSQ
ncbi:MAG: ABC transporter substrate-binding protein [Methylophilaceae bacterium]|nr:ABC transporter substrate-binding protein [Methylophilaceae bacterium]MBL6728278.1 ABC transporter substrate-binding protein [Methylophilaceae bacterium]